MKLMLSTRAMVGCAFPSRCCSSRFASRQFIKKQFHHVRSKGMWAIRVNSRWKNAHTVNSLFEAIKRSSWEGVKHTASFVVSFVVENVEKVRVWKKVRMP